MKSKAKTDILLSELKYSERFINELASFLRNNNVQTILECGCGGGHILNGLAKKGFKGLGLDCCSENINYATEKYPHEKIDFKEVTCEDFKSIEQKFDCVLCRGESLSKMLLEMSGGITTQNPRAILEESIELMLSKIESNGILYLDSVKLADAIKKRKIIETKSNNFAISEEIEYDLENKRKKWIKKGRFHDSEINQEENSYLLTKYELRDILENFYPQEIWSPEIKNETEYDVICARV